MKNITTLLMPALFFSVMAAAPAAMADTATPQPTQSFGDWRLHCTEIAPGDKACALHQKLVSAQTKMPVATFALARHKDSRELRLTAILPLGLDIPVPITGKIGEGATFQYRLQTCLPRGCIASVAVDEAMLKGLNTASSLNVTFKMRAVKEPTTFTVSLKGLPEGLTALDAK